jgi:AcrR family transcriptional regulator
MTDTEPRRTRRADAQRNRARVLEVAAEIFATEGLSVPVHEIARRAGVGTGTVSRHFPTKDDLFAGILLSRMERLTGQADALIETEDPGPAFLTFFAILVREGAAHRGLAEALAGSGYDIEAVGAEAGFDVAGRMRAMLTRAQEAGKIRADVTYADVKALLTGCLARDGDAASLEPIVAVVSQGLRTT